MLAKYLLVGGFRFDIFDFFTITGFIYSIFDYAPPVTKIINVKLLPPLPDHKYKITCTNDTVNGLKGIISKRLKGVHKNSIVLISDGYELIDNNKLGDIFKDDEVSISVQSVDSKGNYIKAPELASPIA
ncbi:hypothetical protein LPJ53_003941 [Coemansia erecta]|uniref:Ubiquitin-like domain-containing protein n=1 Tax=Coemansia erecta TaxID=147472 RepID=A0A9W7Y041_9FUNG|nr:hypothetical protein LPJ53_003941 [Coemansia erecta]